MKFKSEIYKVIHESAVEKFKIGAISEARMQDYNEMCLVKEPEISYKTEKPTVIGHINA